MQLGDTIDYLVVLQKIGWLRAILKQISFAPNAEFVLLLNQAEERLKIVEDAVHSGQQLSISDHALVRSLPYLMTDNLSKSNLQLLQKESKNPEQWIDIDIALQIFMASINTADLSAEDLEGIMAVEAVIGPEVRFLSFIIKLTLPLDTSNRYLPGCSTLEGLKRLSKVRSAIQHFEKKANQEWANIITNSLNLLDTLEVYIQREEPVTYRQAKIIEGITKVKRNRLPFWYEYMLSKNTPVRWLSEKDEAAEVKFLCEILKHL